MKINATAIFFSHETRDFEEITQVFEGETYEYIAREYFDIYGDTLATLKVDGKVVYDNQEEAWEQKAQWADEDDGQPTEYEEWQDYMGGDDWDHGQYDDGGW